MGENHLPYDLDQVLAENFDGDRELMLQVVRIFLEHYQDQIFKLELAINNKDCVEVQKAAHKFKGSVGVLGAQEVQSQLQKLEQIARDKKTEEFTSLFESIKEDVLELVTLLNKWSGSIKN